MWKLQAWSVIVGHIQFKAPPSIDELWSKDYVSENTLTDWRGNSGLLVGNVYKHKLIPIWVYVYMVCTGWFEGETQEGQLWRWIRCLRSQTGWLSYSMLDNVPLPPVHCPRMFLTFKSSTGWHDITPTSPLEPVLLLVQLSVRDLCQVFILMKMQDGNLASYSTTHYNSSDAISCTIVINAVNTQTLINTINILKSGVNFLYQNY